MIDDEPEVEVGSLWEVGACLVLVVAKATFSIGGHWIADRKVWRGYVIADDTNSGFEGRVIAYDTRHLQRAFTRIA